MVEADWGVDDGPSSFGSPARWEPVYSDSPEDVPAVQAARSLGYVPAHEAPLWCFIPAIWPAADRAWVHDRRVRTMGRQCDDGPLERLPWSAAVYADIENDANTLLAELGLPARPAGRIWLLRPPASYDSVQAVLDDIWAGWQAGGGQPMATRAFVEYADRRLREIF